MSDTTATVTEGGRIVIPAAYRKQLGLHPGDRLIVRLDQGELRLMTIQEGVRRAQAIIGRAIPAERSLADELIAQRRAEAAHE